MRAWAFTALFLCTAATPEPPGYWTGPTQAPVPATITGGKVIQTDALAALLKSGGVLLIDVANPPHRPANLPPTSLWLPPPHEDIPGSVWLAGMGEGALTAAQDATFRARLRALTGGTMNKPIVVYCHHACWLSWNAARRAIAYGYTRVAWYPDGVEGWAQAGKKLEEKKGLLS